MVEAGFECFIIITMLTCYIMRLSTQYRSKDLFLSHFPQNRNSHIQNIRINILRSINYYELCCYIKLLWRLLHAIVYFYKLCCCILCVFQ